jgi:hypothetical protein
MPWAARNACAALLSSAPNQHAPWPSLAGRVHLGTHTHTAPPPLLPPACSLPFKVFARMALKMVRMIIYMINRIVSSIYRISINYFSRGAALLSCFSTLCACAPGTAASHCNHREHGARRPHPPVCCRLPSFAIVSPLSFFFFPGHNLLPPPAPFTPQVVFPLTAWAIKSALEECGGEQTKEVRRRMVPPPPRVVFKRLADCWGIPTNVSCPRPNPTHPYPPHPHTHHTHHTHPPRHPLPGRLCARCPTACSCLRWKGPTRWASWPSKSARERRRLDPPLSHP